MIGVFLKLLASFEPVLSRKYHVSAELAYFSRQSKREMLISYEGDPKRTSGI